MTSPTPPPEPSAKVQRYDLHEVHSASFGSPVDDIHSADILPKADGNWVLHSDYAALQSRLLAVEADARRTRDMLISATHYATEIADHADKCGVVSTPAYEVAVTRVRIIRESDTPVPALTRQLTEALAKLAEVEKERESLTKLRDHWEAIGLRQRELAVGIKERELKASMIACSNAWMSYADDLKKAMEKAK